MAMRVLLIAMLLPVLAGCESYTTMMYANISLSDAKQGRECLPQDPLGRGRQLDLSGNMAMHRGGITKVRSLEYQVAKFQGVGNECIIARGE